ncbi:hypothetical protein [Parabacteroides merdae]|jgi:hypothetical protein|uniref:hypothetical protein n=1 Tax=Parabacteroides merdae TaxID=46503 RepID=UPI0034A2B850
MTRGFQIKNIYESVIDELNNNQITMREAAIDLYKAGMFNYIPSEQEVREKLKNYEDRFLKD